MHAGPEQLLAYLAELGIAARTVGHPSVFTVEEGRALRGVIPGAHSKSLFLKDKKGRLFLVIAGEDSAIDLKRLHGTVGASGRLSFGSETLLGEVLGVRPGSVTPFALLNDRDRRVTAVLDRRLAEAAIVNFHPLVNTATTAIAGEALGTFLAATGHPPILVDFSLRSTAADL